MSYIIIAGGISVNDAQDHDRYPYNFINPAVAKAKALKAAGINNVAIALFSPPYEERVSRQKIEHSTVKQTYLPCSQSLWPWGCRNGTISKPKNTRHFTDNASSSASTAGAGFFEIRSADDLTSVLGKLVTINSIYYFGHSNSLAMFLEYSVAIAGKSNVMWTKDDAKLVAQTKFAVGAKFVSYGCNQGDSGGLCEQLSDKSVWGIRCIGSQGKTDFVPIGQNKPFPTSASGWVSYTDGKQDAGAVDIATIV
jgi:hypothetical protein